jgi:hypothetical protein
MKLKTLEKIFDTTVIGLVGVAVGMIASIPLYNMSQRKDIKKQVEKPVIIQCSNNEITNIPQSKEINKHTISPSEIYVHKDFLKEKRSESISGLEKVFNREEVKDMSKKHSEEVIYDNIVTLRVYGEFKEPSGEGMYISEKSSGTGFMITNDGFILTAYHCIDDYIDDWKDINKNHLEIFKEEDPYFLRKNKYYIYDREKKSYPVDTRFYAFNKDLDLALIKVIKNDYIFAHHFKTINQDLKEGEEIKLFAYRDNIPYNQLGKVVDLRFCDNVCDRDKKNEKKIYDVFYTNAYSIPGFSGGIFTTIKGEFAGMILYNKQDEKEFLGEIIDNNYFGQNTGGAKAKNIINLVNESIKELKK